MKEFIDKLIERFKEEIGEAESDNSLTYDERLPYIDGLYNAIAITNQLAEEFAHDINVGTKTNMSEMPTGSEDYCEWKKTDKSKYSPYYHALKHGNITLEFHDDFKFCPYCGKKIKVVE